MSMTASVTPTAASHRYAGSSGSAPTAPATAPIATTASPVTTTTRRRPASPPRHHHFPSQERTPAARPQATGVGLEVMGSSAFGGARWKRSVDNPPVHPSYRPGVTGAAPGG